MDHKKKMTKKTMRQVVQVEISLTAISTLLIPM